MTAKERVLEREKQRGLLAAREVQEKAPGTVGVKWEEVTEA